MFDSYLGILASTTVQHLPQVHFTGCTPIWSIKLDPVVSSATHRIAVADNRPAEQKTFRSVGFLRLWGDSNTTPDRVTLFAARVNELAPDHVSGVTISLDSFEILQDISGSACAGCGLAAVSIPAAVIASSGNQFGDDVFRCTITASVGRVSYMSEAERRYKLGMFDGYKSKIMSDALKRCIDDAIKSWVEEAFQS